MIEFDPVLGHLERAWRNPFDSDAARAHSSYHGRHDGDLVRLLDTAAVSPFARLAHAALRGFVLDEAFPCLGARSAIRRDAYRMGAYARLDDAGVTEGLARDLYAFAAERSGFESDFTTFVAVFRERAYATEEGFERALWSQLQRLHDYDVQYHPWDAAVSNDPADPHFSFSVAGTAFFVVGLHPAASRAARRFAWPALVFNAHEQFEHLRADGRFAGLQTQIRAREKRLSGDLNPNLAEYGRDSEARQYSGRQSTEGWTCPFKPRA
jgi:FPC/CPF motif-containing protein YcgG